MSTHQNGTNLGFVILPKGSLKTLHFWNDNFDDVKCMLAIIVYNHSAPVPGGCSELKVGLNVEDNGSFVVLRTSPSQLSNEMMDQKRVECGSEGTRQLRYFTYYIYLEQMNFQHDVYFKAIESLLFINAANSSFQAKQVLSPLRRYFEKTSGTGLIMNSVVTDNKGQSAFYVPAVTYSCPANTWNTHCTDIDMLMRAFCVILVLFAVVMILNLVMPELIEAIMNGMLVGAFWSMLYMKNHNFLMSSFDKFMTTVFGGFFVSAIFGTMSLYFRVGRYLTKLTFSNLLMAIITEVFFESTTSIYWQFGGAFVMSFIFNFARISFSVLLGGFLLIMGLSQLLKVGNIHRLIINNFNVLFSAYSTEDNVWSFERQNFINYKIQLNLVDCSLIIFYIIGAVLLTIRKEIYFLENPNLYDADRFFSSENDDVENYNRNVARSRKKRCIVGIRRSSALNQLRIISRYRRHHYRSNVINERSPLISHWIESDESEDDVFESPQSNSRFMESLPTETKLRVDAVQDFTKL